MKPSLKPKGKIGWKDAVRLGVAIVALWLCYHLASDAARGGLARLYSMAAIVEMETGPADRAVATMPSDPEAHYTRALSLANAGRLDEALTELREATRLRSHHYYEWLDLGVTLDRVGDANRAEAALRRSVALAPSFAQPHWQLGNLLYRAERYQEAFQELRLGAKSDPNLTEGLLRLAWAAANGNPSVVVSLAQPQSQREYVVLARFLVAQGKGHEAVEQARAAGPVLAEEDRALLVKAVEQLLVARDFSSAYDLWALIHPATPGQQRGQIINPDFKDPIVRDDPGFGWQLPVVPSVSVTIDSSGPQPGTRSLRLDFGGDNPALTPLVNQLVLLDPGKRYTLSFDAKTDNLVSGGPPVVAALTQSGDPPRILGQSTPPASATTGWTSYHFEFRTDETDGAVVFSLRRQQCTQTPCPIFGRLWISRFSINKV